MGVDPGLENDQLINADQGGRASLTGQTLPGNLHVFQRLGETSAGPLYRAEYASRYGFEASLEVSLVVLQRGTHGGGPPRQIAEAGSWHDSFHSRWIAHPNILAMHGVGDISAGGRFVATEPLGGDSLSKVLEGGGLPFRDAMDLFAQAAAGVEAIHDTGTFYGHLSPDSILVTRAEAGRRQLKLLPFDLRTPRPPRSDAPLPSTDIWMAYASPERVAGHAMDKRSDIYSLGALLHHLLAGVPPGFEPARAGTLSESVREVLLRALAPSPGNRFQTVREFVSALERAKPSLRRWLRVSSWRTFAVVATRTLAVGRRALALVASRTLAVSRRALALGAQAAQATFAATRRHARLAVAGLILGLAITGVWHFRALFRHLIHTSRQQLVLAMRPTPAAGSHPGAPARPRELRAKALETSVRKLKTRQQSDSSPQPLRRTGSSRPAANRETAVPTPPALHLPTPRSLPVAPIESGRLELRSSALLSVDSLENTPSGDRDAAIVRVNDVAARERSRDRPSESGRSTINSEALRNRAFQLAVGDAQRLRIATQVGESRPGVLIVEVGPGLETVSSARYTLGRLFSAYAEASLMANDTVIELRRDGAKIGEVTSRGIQITNSPHGPYEP
jgi:serine/threonine protein kinase